MALGGLLLDDVELLIESYTENVTFLGVFQKVDAEQIPQTRPNMLALNNILGRTIRSPRRLIGISSTQGIDLGVFGKGGEHGSGLAGLQVEDELVVLAVDFGEGGDEVLGVEVFGGECDKARGAVVREEQEDVVVLGGFEDLAAALAGDCGLVALEDVEEDGRVDAGSFIVDYNTRIHVYTGVGISWLVEDLALEGVLDIISNIIIGEGNNFFWGKSIFF